MDKIIFFDIDGTLFYPGIGIPQSARRSLKQLKENGHKMVICTGRSKGMIPESYFHLGFDGMIIGAGSYVEYNGKVLHRQMMTKEQLDKVIDWGRQENLGIILEGEKHGYYDPQNHDAYYREVKRKAQTDFESTLRSMDEALDYQFKGVYHEALHAIEFIPRNVNKAKGIQKILEYTGIPRENTYAFGDSANDLDMIKYVQYGIAMGNAVQELSEIAPYHTARADEDGIEKGLMQFGLIS